MDAQGVMNEPGVLSQGTLVRILRAYDTGELHLISVLADRREALSTWQEVPDT